MVVPSKNDNLLPFVPIIASSRSPAAGACILKYCCSVFWVSVTLLQQMPSLLGCHLILRNLKYILMFHLLWDIDKTIWHRGQFGTIV